MIQWSPEQVATMFGASAAVACANDIGLIEALCGEPRTLQELAQALACDVRALEALSGVLEALGLTEVRDGRLSMRPNVRDNLTRLPGHVDMQAALWRTLPEYARHGQSLLRGAGARRDVPYAQVVRSLGRYFAGAAAELAESLPHARGPILDVGAGSGVWSLAMAARDPMATVTAVDGAQTCQVFLQCAQDAGLEGQAHTLAGDYHEVELSDGFYARAVLANVLHLEAPAQARALVSRIAAAVQPGGSLVIVDAVSDGTPDDALHVAVYRLHLSMRVQESAVYARGDFETWVRDAGLTPHPWRRLSNSLWALEVSKPC